MTISGSSFGFMIGCICDDEQAAINVLSFFVILFDFGAGALTNLGNANWFCKMLGVVSPLRYSCELLMRALLRGNPGEVQDFVLDFYSYNYGETRCYLMLAAFTVLYFFVAWLVLTLKARTI